MISRKQRIAEFINGNKEFLSTDSVADLTNDEVELLYILQNGHGNTSRVCSEGNFDKSVLYSALKGGKSLKKVSRITLRLYLHSIINKYKNVPAA